MNVEIKIVAPGLEQALNNLAAAIAGRPTASDIAKFADENTVKNGAEDKAPKTRAPRAAKPEPTEPSTPATSEETDTSATSDTASEQESDTSASETTVDYKDIKAAVLTLATTKGRDQVVAILKDFGVPEGGKADQVDEARWSDLLAKLTAAAA